MRAQKSLDFPLLHGGFQKWTPIAGWFILENPKIKWMSWGYPYFRKPPYEEIVDSMVNHGPPTDHQVFALRTSPAPPIGCGHFAKAPLMPIGTPRHAKRPIFFVAQEGAKGSFFTFQLRLIWFGWVPLAENGHCIKWPCSLPSVQSSLTVRNILTYHGTKMNSKQSS